jgi:hypothetical protein
MDISILLPTRGRSDILMHSLCSLFDLATDFSNIEIIFGFDNDDKVGVEYFKNTIQPWLDEKDITYTGLNFDPMGYQNLHQYLNKLAEHGDGDWLFFWNDDAVMKTQGWDDQIRAKTGEFKLLSVITHNEHPYSLFPIFPQEWYSILGYLSQHSLNDAYVSQIAYSLDIFERIPVYCDHDRADLTGKNNDDTYRKRVVLEGQKHLAGDINHPDVAKLKYQDGARIANWLIEERGQDMSFFARVLEGEQDPWEKLKLNDTNKQMAIG